MCKGTKLDKFQITEPEEIRDEMPGRGKETPLQFDLLSGDWKISAGMRRTGDDYLHIYVWNFPLRFCAI